MNPTSDEIAAAVVHQLRVQQCAMLADPETHAAQHAFLKMLMDERAERIARRKRIQERIAGSLILSTIGAAIGWLGWVALEAIRQWLERGAR